MTLMAGVIVQDDKQVTDVDWCICDDELEKLFDSFFDGFQSDKIQELKSSFWFFSMQTTDCSHHGSTSPTCVLHWKLVTCFRHHSSRPCLTLDYGP
jgi:hypothetical protein